MSGDPLLPPEDCLAGGGEMGALMRSIDWSTTKLGPVAGWPQSLKTTVGIVLGSRFPMALFWGPSFVMLYNDGYWPILGLKHPASMGAPGPQIWAEIWDVVGPQAQGVLAGGAATWNEHLLLLMNRRGFVEETYFTFSYSPIPGDTERVGGVLITVQETTEQVYDARQLRMLSDLASRSAAVKSAEEACHAAADILAANDADLPFSLLYLVDRDAREARLVTSSGLDGVTIPAAAASVPLHDGAVLPLAEAARAGHEVIVDDLGACFGALPGGRWGVPPERAVVLPLTRPGQPHPYGFLVGGVSPRRYFDERYVGLFRLTADQVTTAIANARTYEEERRRAEALAEIDRAKTAFFSNVSHELRTPLTLILGPMEDALASPERALAGEVLEAAHRNALRLLKLVNTLLDFSRIEAGRAQIAYEPTDLAALTAELASAFQSAIQRAGLTFEVDAPKLPEPAFVDRDMWEKIVLNLLSNALKFTFEGSIRVALRARGDHAELTVRDTGTGIPAEHLPRLFERFHRIYGAKARAPEGSGIGLALVHELVRLHGGSIRVESALGEGTTFTVAIPLGSAHLPSERVGAEKALASTATGVAPYVQEAMRWLPRAEADERSGRLAATALTHLGIGAIPINPNARILLADDNADMRAYVKRILGERWKIEAAHDGEEALAAVRRSPPDLVLTDVMMPKLDGFGLLRALREGEATREMPVIMLSARAGDEARVEGLEAGADDYLVKPFSARELVARVATHLQLAALRRAAEQERARLYELFEQAPVVIAVLRGPDHVFELANPRYLETFGRRDILGRAARDVFPELEGTPIFTVLDRVYTTGEPFVTHEYRLDLVRDGARAAMYADFTYHPVREADGTIDRILAVAVDVTEQVRARRKLEEATQEREELLRREQAARREAELANRAKDEFLALLGHELRNPLAPIVTALHLMKLRLGGAAERERAVIERQVTHVVHLVDDLLDISRITRGKVELKREQVEIAQIVAKAIEQASPLFEQRRHHLEVAVPASGLVVDGDTTRLAQVVSNLLTNAAKYTESGGTIRVEAERDDRGEVVLRVRDDGIGIAPEMLPRIFDLFVQERQAIDRSQGGLGLGLSIVKSLVALHGGSVGVHSEGQGRGSEFTIRLPSADPASAATEAPPSAPVAAPAEPAAGVRVLVVDDNQDAAALLTDALGVLGHTARAAHDGPDALALTKEFVPDVAVLDIGLPVMDGYELARRLREQPALAHVRLIALTGYGQEADRRRSKEAGFDAHLVKPVQLDALEALVERLLRERR